MNAVQTPAPSYADSVAAMRDKRTQADNWRLGDALISDVPQHASRSGFERVRRAAESAGVNPLSVSALRQYRDVCVAWPPARRVAGASFSAHRAAMRAEEPERLLSDLAGLHGAENVTVKQVEQALRVTSGAAPVSAPAPELGAAPVSDLVRELVSRFDKDGSRTVAALSGDSRSVARLTELVESASKSAAGRAKSAAAWNKSTAPAPSKSTAPAPDKSKSKSTAPKSTRKRGNVRGL